jgi:hypothetical protein
VINAVYPIILFYFISYLVLKIFYGFNPYKFGVFCYTMSDKVNVFCRSTFFGSKSKVCGFRMQPNPIRNWYKTRRAIAQFYTYMSTDDWILDWCLFNACHLIHSTFSFSVRGMWFTVHVFIVCTHCACLWWTNYIHRRHLLIFFFTRFSRSSSVRQFRTLRVDCIQLS